MGTGGNGKTTFLDTYKRAAGEYATELEATVLKATKHDRHSTEVADLELSRVASCEEIGDSRLNSNRLKHLSGGGTVRARRMRTDTREFRATWSLWLTTNGLPQTDDNSQAFWRRVVVLNFPNVFKRDAEPGLEATLREEMPGILTGIVQGAVEFYAEGLGEEPESVLEHTKQYREDIDPLEGLFESGILVEDATAKTPTAELYAAYQRWVQVRNVVLPYAESGFARALAGRFERKRWVSDGTGLKVRGFVGVKVGLLLEIRE